MPLWSDPGALSNEITGTVLVAGQGDGSATPVYIPQAASPTSPWYAVSICRAEALFPWFTRLVTNASIQLAAESTHCS